MKSPPSGPPSPSFHPAPLSVFSTWQSEGPCTNLSDQPIPPLLRACSHLLSHSVKAKSSPCCTRCYIITLLLLDTTSRPLPHRSLGSSYLPVLCSLNTPSVVLPRDLCTGCSRCPAKCSSPDVSMASSRPSFRSLIECHFSVKPV